MRRFIIDTDIGSDDAVALIMALKEKNINIEAITTVAGNCSIENVINNALMTVEVVNREKVPVYCGAYRPIIRNKIEAVNVHGNDGMGDCDLIHPKTKLSEGHAVNKILEIVEQYPNEIEIICLGPVTNIALAIMLDREKMKNIKRIWSMGTSGFGAGNTTPYAEFNVYADPEGYDILLKSNIPLTIIGFDLCIQKDSPLNESDLEKLIKSGNPEAEFAVKCNKELLNYNLRTLGKHIIDLPDAVAMAVALWDDIVIDAPKCYCETCLNQGLFYGQVGIFEENKTGFVNEIENYKKNITVIKSINVKKFKEKLMNSLLK